MTIRAGRQLVSLLTLVASGACGVSPASVPSPAGPSEFALSLSLAAEPDVISQDGVSAAVLTVVARNAAGEPLAGLGLRVDTMIEAADDALVVADFGELGERWLTTRSDGSARVGYRAPPPPAAGTTADRTVTFRVQAIGSDHANAVARFVSVRLLRPGVIRPPTRMVPAFTFSPSTPREFDAVYFDASPSSDPDRQIAAYAWQFGDGTFGTGRTSEHIYRLAGSYGVTLTVQDNQGVAVTSAPVEILVTSSPLPVARFTASPTDPATGQAVIFNAAASTAPPGRRIVRYLWDFGDGATAEGVAPRHVFERPGTYSIVLSVVDDAGRAGVASGTVTVTEPMPVAAFTVSPTDPSVGSLVVFNGAASTAPPGRTLTAHNWDFGDGTSPGSGVAVTHVFARAGTFTVVLKVTDSGGGSSVTSVTVTVGAPP